MAKKSNTTPVIIGLLAAGAIGYYLYYKNTADTVNGVEKQISEGTYKVKKIGNAYFAVFEFNDGEVLFLSKSFRTEKNAEKRLLKHLDGVNINGESTYKYYIEFIMNGIEQYERFEKIPSDKYLSPTSGIYYVTRLTDYGTTLIPLMDIKTNLPLKK